MKSIIPLAAGIFSVGALLYLYIRRREKDKKKDSDDGLDPIETLEFLLKKQQVPAIVGRNSVVLKSIEEKTNTVIEFRDSDEDHQICSIKGKKDDVAMAKDLIDIEAAKPCVITDELLVPISSCGKLEGYSGSALHEICSKSSAKVWVDPGSRKNQAESRRVLITGTEEQVQLAKKLIEEKIREVSEEPPADEKKDEIKREPRSSPSRYASNSSITATDTPREVMLPSPEKLKNNDGHLEVFVSAVNSPSRFWVQLVGPQSTELDFLVDAMTVYYNEKENQELHQIREPYLGQIVAAMFFADNKWYRAEIIAIQVNETIPHELLFDVYFLDYGDNQFIGKKDILELRADFLSLRFQAIECFLAHVHPLNNSSKLDEWDEKAVEKFEEMVKAAQWKKLISKVVTYKERKSFAFQRQANNKRESSPIPGVELYDPDENPDKNIALELVKLGYAEMTDNFGDLSRSAILNSGLGDGEDLLVKAVKEKSPFEVPSPVKETSPVKEPSPVKEQSPAKEPSPVKEQSSIREPSPVKEQSSIKEPSPVKEVSPSKEDFPSLPAVTAETTTNDNHNNSVKHTNGSPTKPTSNIFKASKPSKSSKGKKQQLSEFLKNEQQSTSKKPEKSETDWNAMLEE